MQTATAKKFESLQVTAHRLGVPATWLKVEAEAGRVPHLKVSRRLLFNVDTVERVLLERTEAAGQ